MAHKEQQDFIRYVKDKFPNFFQGKFVLDIGSLDINGSNLEFFEDCGYIGVDISYGKNVDIVCFGHELALPDCTFDVVISTETFEHDPFYPKTIRNMYRLLKPGGLFIFTCATTGRDEHGTSRKSPEDSPFIANHPEFCNYYKNLTEEDVRKVIDIEKSFEEYEFIINKDHHDLYFWGLKKGKFVEHNGYSFLLKKAQQIEKIKSLQMEIGRLKSILEDTQREVEYLRSRNEELLGELIRMHLSSSWKITRPLRWLRRKIGI